MMVSNAPQYNGLATGKRYVCQNKNKSEDLIVKIVKKNDASTREVDTLKKIVNETQNSPFLELIDHFDSQTHHIIITKKYDTDLIDYIGKKRYIQEKEAKMIFKNICQALKILHSWQIIHNDVKPDNVFLKTDSNGKMRVHLGDFSSIRYHGETISKETGVTEIYMAPEIYNAVKDNKKSASYRPTQDIYSLGILLFGMLTGVYPFCCSHSFDFQWERNQQINENIFTDKIAEKYKRLTPTSIDLIRNLLNYDVAKRFQSVDQILNHSWLHEHEEK